MQENNYLGTERVGKLLKQFAVPCILSLIISCLYNIVDQIFVGNGVGYLGNAATGVIFPITVIGWGASLFFGDGAAAALSVSLGQQKTKIIHKIVGNSILCSFLSGVVIIAISYGAGDQLLTLIGATDANLELAHDYGFIIFAMMPLALVQNTLASIIRPDGALLKRIMALGSSSLLTQLSIVVITVINNVLLVRYGAQSAYGADIPLAAFVVLMKLFQIVLNIAIGIAAGAQPIVGYNYGAEKYDRVKALLKLMIRWTIIICLICTVLFEAIPQVFIRMFGAEGELYMQFAVLCLRIYLSLILFTCVQKVCAIFLQSIGHAKAAAPLSILRDVVLILFSLLLPVKLGVTGIFWAAPLADVIAMAITIWVMVRVWKQLSQGSGRA